MRSHLPTTPFEFNVQYGSLKAELVQNKDNPAIRSAAWFKLANLRLNIPLAIYQAAKANSIDCPKTENEKNAFAIISYTNAMTDAVKAFNTTVAPNVREFLENIFIVSSKTLQALKIKHPDAFKILEEKAPEALAKMKVNDVHLPAVQQAVLLRQLKAGAKGAASGAASGFFKVVKPKSVSGFLLGTASVAAAAYLSLGIGPIVLWWLAGKQTGDVLENNLDCCKRKGLGR